MISNFFVLSPRGDTILAKQYRLNDHILRGDAKEIGAHERSHTEAFFRKIKFWDDNTVDGGCDGDDDDVVAAASTTTTGTNGINGTLSTDDIAGVTATTNGKNGHHGDKSKQKYDAPPVFPMPDGYTYFHIKRNGLIFAASSVRNASPNTVLEVSKEKKRKQTHVPTLHCFYSLFTYRFYSIINHVSRSVICLNFIFQPTYLAT
jgi:hypothetical protein